MISFSRQTRELITDVRDLFVTVWIKDLPITLALFLLVFSLWIPPIAYEAVTASLLSLGFSPIIKEKIRRGLQSGGRN